MFSRKYSRLIVFRKAGDDASIGLVSLHSPLGFSEEGADLVAFFREAGAARVAQQALASRGVAGALTTDIAEGDPLEAFRVASRPFAVGARFWIDPGDAPASAPPNGRIAISVPASLAFGTGGHESTRLALVALEEAVDGPVRALDVGTGSGILALAAAALGASRVVAFDVDADAVFVARENLRRHPFGERVRLAAGEITAISGRFDLVTANMLTEELLPLREELLARLDRRGRLVLSGFPAEREEEIVARFRSARVRLVSRRRENDWSSLCLARGSS